ncbi:PREDICTED: transmembrane protein 214 [Aptenodytes forsteri]|nr:PREDICTED: transmembrane protein 214 [Aptenodytes forsteri]
MKGGGAFPSLDLADLQKELDKSQSVFPENPSVWVKDLAGYLNYKLQAPRSDPMLSQHPHDYPYCLVSKELKNIIRSLLGRSSSVLELFFDHCIYTMLQELDKTRGESLHGYRICIQAVLLDRPKIATMNLGKLLLADLRSARADGRNTLCGRGALVWLGVMLPVLGIKSLSPYAVAYLDRLLMMHPNLTKGFGMIGPKDFFPLLDFAFMPNNSLPPSLQEQLRRLYPRLKVLAFGAKPETALHTYFPSFLSRATPSCPPGMKKELLTSMSQCLSLDPLSFSVWRQLYTKHLSQSSLLLNHLLESWDSSSKKVGVSCRKEESYVGWGDNVPVLLREVPVRAASPWDLCVPTQRCSGTSAARRVRWRGHVPATLESRHFVLGTGNTLPAGRAFYLLADGEESPLSLDVLRRDSDIPDSAPVRPCCSGAVTSGEVALAAAQCPQRSSTAPAALARRLAGSAEALGLSAGASEQELLCKMKGRGFPWSRLLLVLLVFAAGFLLHDVRTHGSFQASSSARLLRSSGVLPASQQAWQKVSHCCLEGYSC